MRRVVIGAAVSRRPGGGQPDGGHSQFRVVDPTLARLVGNLQSAEKRPLNGPVV